MVKSIIIIIIINLGQTPPSKPKKIVIGNGQLTQVAWVCQERKPKLLGSYNPAWPNALGYGIQTQGCWV